MRGDRTHGLVFDPSGKALAGGKLIVSGDDPTTMQDLSLNQRERLASSLLADVEPKIAARMRHRDLPIDSVLVLNNIPCKGLMSRQEYLPPILPAGSRLAVYVSDGSSTRLFRIFHGTGEQNYVMTVTPLKLAWGSQPDDDHQYETVATTSQELGAVLDSIHAQALAQGLPQ